MKYAIKNKPWICISVLMISFCFLCSPLHVCAKTGEPAVEITNEAAVAFSFGGSTEYLFDENVDTYVPLYDGEYFKVSFENSAGWFYFEWYAIPMEGYILRQYSETNQILSEDHFTKENGYLNHGVRISKETRSITVTINGDGGALSTVSLFSEGEKPQDLQIWKPPFLKTDLLIFSSHPDDEQLFFGTVLPLYAGEYELADGIVYMSHQRRLRQSEALAGLWVCGQRTYPTFAGFEDRYCYTAADAAAIWGADESLGFIVAAIRRYKPEVVVTHGVGGEYGHGMHKYLAASLMQAVELTNDPTIFPESADQYGVWQVKKLYLHGEGSDPVGGTGQGSEATPETDKAQASEATPETETSPASDKMQEGDNGQASEATPKTDKAQASETTPESEISQACSTNQVNGTEGISGKNQINVISRVKLPYDRPLTAFGGRTAFDMAVQGYDCHRSQHIYDFHVSVTNRFSCAVFDLVFSTVGSDSLGNNLFENIPRESFSNPEVFRRMQLENMTVRTHRFLAPGRACGMKTSWFETRDILAVRGNRHSQ